jgi:diguanylate cyclase (GGDEF)-like protein
MLLAVAGLLFQLQVVAPHAVSATELGGPWLFRAGDNSEWASPGFDDRGWTRVMVPGQWSPPAPGSYRGYGWYRLHIELRPPIVSPLGLWLHSVATAFQVYVDGQPLGGYGGFPPGYRARSVIPLVVALPLASQTAGAHVIAVRVYSEETSGGLTGPVEIGPLRDLLAAARGPDLFLLSAAVLLIGIAVIQVFFWVRRPLARENAAIFAVCVCLALFFVVWMPSVRIATEPWIFWLRLYCAAAAAAAAAFAYAFRRIFDLDRYDRFIQGLALVYLVQVPLYLGVPSWSVLRTLSTWVLNSTLLAGSAVTLVLAALQLRSGARHARVLLWGSLILGITLAHDVLGSWGLIALQPSFPWLLVVGSVVFVVSLALTTAERFVESETAALYDRLTGLYRREVVMDALSREIRRSARMGQPLAVIMLDVDRFKQINDTLGHQAGDKVLHEIGRRMVEAGRAVDWLGRYGGEEFVGVLAATSQAGAVLAAERLRSAVASLPIATGRTTRTVTLSAGVATYDGGAEWPTTEQLVGAADAALYRAKDAGRNCVVS